MYVQCNICNDLKIKTIKSFERISTSQFIQGGFAILFTSNHDIIIFFILAITFVSLF